MVALRELPGVIRDTVAEWLRVRWYELLLPEVWTTLLIFSVLLAISLLTLLARGLWVRKAGRTHVALPAVLPVMRQSYWSATRHGAFLVFLLGLPFFALALADPRTTFMHEESSYPGRRIALVIDGSASMVMRFSTLKLQTPEVRKDVAGVHSSAAFYASIAAAEHFMKLRMNGRYRDLIALIQFGNEAYVVTPFTTDYENVLLGVRLIGQPTEWGRFEDAGTTIIQALEQGTQLFRTFDFLGASGNLMIIFSDGRDPQTQLRGRTLDDILAGAREHKIPVYMIRPAFDKKLGEMPDDKLWKPAIERTGGRFYAAPDENSILQALGEIDRLSPGRIELREYTSERPRFSGYALIAVGLWLVSGLLKLGLPYFRTFP